MTMEPHRERGGIESPVEKPEFSHEALDVALLYGVQGIDVLEHRRMNEGDAAIYKGAVEIARLNYETEYRNWRAGRHDIHKVEDRGQPRVPSLEVIADNLQYGAVEKVGGAKLVRSLDLDANAKIAALMDAARVVEGRAVTESGPVRLVRRAGVMAIELVGGEASVSNDQLYLQNVVNKIINKVYGEEEERNIGPWASPFLWEEAIKRLKDIKALLPDNPRKDPRKNPYEELKYLTIPLAVGLEQSLVLTGNRLAYPGTILGLADAVRKARIDARYGKFSVEFTESIKRRYRTDEAQAAALEHARRDAFMRKLLPLFIRETPHVPRPRRPPNKY